MKEYLLLTVLPNFGCFLFFIITISFIGILIGLFIYFSFSTDEETREEWGFSDIEQAKLFIKRLRYRIKILIYISLCSFFISIFIPSKKDLLQIKFIQVMQETKGLDKLPEKLVAKINRLLDIEDEK